jgi:hypothetical protein
MVLEPGDYACSIQIPGLDGTLRELSAQIELIGGNRPPRGDIFGDVPLMIESGAAPFPQIYTYPLLRGRLRTNQELLLFDVSLTDM